MASTTLLARSHRSTLPVRTTSGPLLVLRPPRAHALRLLPQVLPVSFLGFHVSGSSLDPASFVSTCFGLQWWLEVVAVEGFWFVKFARKEARKRSTTGCYQPFGDGYTRRSLRQKTLQAHGSLRSLPGRDPGERVPLWHSSECPLLLSERLFVSSLPEGQEASRACRGRFFDIGLLRFIQFVRSAFSAADIGRPYNPPSLQLRFANPAVSSLSSRPRLADGPNCCRGPQGDLVRVSGRSVGLSFPRARA